MLIMDKKKIAKLFVESFGTDIELVDFEHERNGKKTPHVVFHNHSMYEKSQFTADFKKFAKKLATEYGIANYKDIMSKERSGSRSFYYIWDPSQYIVLDSLKFTLERRRMNLPHSIMDGVSQCFYVVISDEELAKEVEKLNDERLAREDREKKNAFPQKVQDTKDKCSEMIAVLQKFVNGEKDIDEDAVSRLDSAHFQVCKMLR